MSGSLVLTNPLCFQYHPRCVLTQPRYFHFNFSTHADNGDDSNGSAFLGDQSVAVEEHEEEEEDDNDSQTFIESNPMNNRRAGDSRGGYGSSGLANTSTGAASRPRPLLVNPTRKITLASSIVGHASLANTSTAVARTPARADAMARATADIAVATESAAGGSNDEENDLVTPFDVGEDDEDDDAVFAFDGHDDKNKITKQQGDLPPPHAPATTTITTATTPKRGFDSDDDDEDVVPTATTTAAKVPSEITVAKLSVAERVAAFQQKLGNNSSSSTSSTASPKRHAASPMPSPRLSLASATTSLASLDRPYTGSVQPPPAALLPVKGQELVSVSKDKGTEKTTEHDNQQQQTDKGLGKEVEEGQRILTIVKPVTASVNVTVAAPPSPAAATSSSSSSSSSSPAATVVASSATAAAPSSSAPSSFFRTQPASVRFVSQSVTFQTSLVPLSHPATLPHTTACRTSGSASPSRQPSSASESSSSAQPIAATPIRVTASASEPGLAPTPASAGDNSPNQILLDHLFCTDIVSRHYTLPCM